MDCVIPGFPVLHHLLEFAQIHVHWVSDAIQPSHPLLPTLSCVYFIDIKVLWLKPSIAGSIILHESTLEHED